MDSTVIPTRSEYVARLPPSLAERAVRSLIILCIGVGGTLAWQSYGDAARATIANLSSKLGWVAPQTTTVAQTAPEKPAAETTSPNLEQFVLDVASVRESVNQLASQLAANQQQMASEIAKVQADEQQILRKLSAASPKPASSPRKPTPVTPPSPTAEAR